MPTSVSAILLVDSDFGGDSLTGSDETLDNAHLMRMAGRFSRRVRGWAQAHQIPVIDCSAGRTQA